MSSFTNFEECYSLTLNLNIVTNVVISSLTCSFTLILSHKISFKPPKKYIVIVDNDCLVEK